MAVSVRSLRADDYSQWRPLWEGYTHFYDCYLDESVTASTWERALSDNSPLFLFTHQHIIKDTKSFYIL